MATEGDSFDRGWNAFIELSHPREIRGFISQNLQRLTVHNFLICWHPRWLEPQGVALVSINTLRLFCVADQEELLAKHGTSNIFTADQVCQFTSFAFTHACWTMESAPPWRLWPLAEQRAFVSRRSVGTHYNKFCLKRPHHVDKRPTWNV